MGGRASAGVKSHAQHVITLLLITLPYVSWSCHLPRSTWSSLVAHTPCWMIGPVVLCLPLRDCFGGFPHP